MAVSGKLVLRRDFIGVLPISALGTRIARAMTYVLLLRFLQWKGLNRFNACYSWGNEIVEIVG